MENVLWPLIGGILIGLSSSIMLGGPGRITGMSGIISQTLSLPHKKHFWRYAFLLGLISGGLLLKNFYPEKLDYSFESSTFKIILGGLLVGYGTRLGSGCTSGHGVCGLPRMAKRSFSATILFILFGMLTVLITKGL